MNLLWEAAGLIYIMCVKNNFKSEVLNSHRCVVQPKLTLVVLGHTPAASLGSQLCGRDSLVPAPAGFVLQNGADRSREVVMAGADRNEAH